MRTVLQSAGLNCPSCAYKIETALKTMDGVTRARVHFASGRIVVDYDPERANGDSLTRAIRALGYDARAVGHNE